MINIDELAVFVVVFSAIAVPALIFSSGALGFHCDDRSANRAADRAYYHIYLKALVRLFC